MRYLAGQDPVSSRHWPAFWRLSIWVMQLGYPVPDLLAAAFDVLEPPRGMRFLPPQALTIERLRYCWAEWRRRNGYRTEQQYRRDAAGPDTLRLALAAAESTVRRWIRHQRAGLDLESFLRLYGQTVSAWWIVSQPWWGWRRGELLQQARSERRAELLHADQNWRAFRHEFLTVMARAAIAAAAER